MLYLNIKINMQSTQPKNGYALNHISIDSVILGFDGKDLKVLLVPQKVEVGAKLLYFKKLPGDLIFKDEDFEVAAHRTLNDLTGIHDADYSQWWFTQRRIELRCKNSSQFYRFGRYFHCSHQWHGRDGSRTA